MTPESLTADEVVAELGYDPDDYKHPDYLDDLLDRLDAYAV